MVAAFRRSLIPPRQAVGQRTASATLVKVETRARELAVGRVWGLRARRCSKCGTQYSPRTLAFVLLARSIGLPADHVEVIRHAAPLRDVGKIGIPDGILLKPSKLTDEEYTQIKRHAEIGKIILSGSKFPILQMAERIALYHHERWDGAGYYRLQGSDIPLEARIVSIVDVFDVITHARPYKPALGVDVALEELDREKGKQFDPTLADAFLELQPSRGLRELGTAIAQEEQPVPQELKAETK